MIKVDDIVYVRARVMTIGKPTDWWAFEVETVDRLGKPGEHTLVNVVRDPSHIVSAADLKRIAGVTR